MKTKLILGLIVILVILIAINLNKAQSQEVVIYVSHDQDYSEPILQAFEKESGIKVKAVYDTEASKTVGLTNRLISEKNNPQADVFWNNEVTRTIQLQKEGVLTQYYPQNYEKIAAEFKDVDGYWTGFAARARVLVANKDNLANNDYPITLEDLTKSIYKDKVTLADPRFGTTGSHLAALYSLWGETKTFQYLRDLKSNGLNIAQSNGQTRDKVVNGEMLIGFTDTDDAYDAVKENLPVDVIYPNKEDIGTLVIPNTAMLIKGAPNEENAKLLIDYLISSTTEIALARSKAAQIPLIAKTDLPPDLPSLSNLKSMAINWSEVYTNLETILNFVETELIQ